MENLEKQQEFMRLAIAISIDNVKENKGGPFGAVVVKNNVVIAASGNKVTTSNDPTAHAEVSAIRLACEKLNSFDLSGCEIYTSCEPCPMCLGAIYWSRIDKIYMANTKVDADLIGFSDKFIYDELEKPVDQRSLTVTTLLRDEAIEAFKLWENSNSKVEY